MPGSRSENLDKLAGMLCNSKQSADPDVEYYVRSV
jgi:hypothetical protein